MCITTISDENLPCFTFRRGILHISNVGRNDEKKKKDENNGTRRTRERIEMSRKVVRVGLRNENIKTYVHGLPNIIRDKYSLVRVRCRSVTNCVRILPTDFGRYTCVEKNYSNAYTIEVYRRNDGIIVGKTTARGNNTKSVLYNEID